MQQVAEKNARKEKGREQDQLSKARRRSKKKHKYEEWFNTTVGDNG